MKVNSKVLVVLLVGLLALAFLVTGCGKATTEKPADKANEPAKLSGTIKIDGSSTVYPISEGVAEEFMKLHKEVQVTVGFSGTGGGFKKFTAGETDISDASRPIKDAEKEAAKTNGIEYIEMPIAYDGISVVVNKDNNWVDSMTVEELKKLWEPESKITKWNQIRPEWPDMEIKLYGPGTDSGTFEYFTEAIVGEAKKSRGDYTASEDDNQLVTGVSGDKGALGYFGYAYYLENKDKLKIVAVDGGNGPVVPSSDTINNGTYKPLSRPIFIYPSKKSLERPEVKEFVKYYLTEGVKIIPEVGYVPMPDSVYKENLAKLQ
ncbi:hypothetical protein SY88_13000 [Clostridiales bacterium PH28_bin88]|nr:hypothetical protein SY88_13000 [Clostridiales bacterium PH28_bin88]